MTWKKSMTPIRTKSERWMKKKGLARLGLNSTPARTIAALASTALLVLMMMGSGTKAGAAGMRQQKAPEGAMHGQEASTARNAEKQMTTTQSSFFCNIKALTPEERAHHKELTEKLMKMRKEAVETLTGYEFQYSPGDVSLDELVDWVKAEAKCCPFFDFHIDVEAEGKLFCLRLTGQEGIKAFIRSEFQMQGK